MSDGSTGSTTDGDGYGWGPNNELFEALWPMEIPPPVTENERDPVELPIRVPTSFMTNQQGVH